MPLNEITHQNQNTPQIRQFPSIKHPKLQLYLQYYRFIPGAVALQIVLRLEKNKKGAKHRLERFLLHVLNQQYQTLFGIITVCFQ